MLGRIISLVFLCGSLQGCFYAKQAVLDNLPSKPHCPFQERVTYEGFAQGSDPQGNPAQISLGKFRFIEDADTGKCLLTDAADLSPSASPLLGKTLQSTTKHVADGVQVSYIEAEQDADTSYNNIELITRFDDGSIEVRGSCKPANGAEKLVLSGVPVDSEGTSCHLDTAAALQALAKNFRSVALSQVFRPAGL